MHIRGIGEVRDMVRAYVMVYFMEDNKHSCIRLDVGDIDLAVLIAKAINEYVKDIPFSYSDGSGGVRSIDKAISAEILLEKETYGKGD